MLQLQILKWRVKITPRKIVMHTLMHESRHWAQIATLWRLNGLPVAFHDFLGSPGMGGSRVAISHTSLARLGHTE